MSNMKMHDYTCCHDNDTNNTPAIVKEKIFLTPMVLFSDLALFTIIPAGFLHWYSNLKPGLFWE